MEIRVALAIKAILKALDEVVLPAVSPDNKLAQEQGHLIVALLGLIAQRDAMSYEYDVDELRRLIGLASDLQSLADDPVLNANIAAAEEVLLNARISPARLIQTSCQLSSVLADQIEVLVNTGTELACTAAKTVLAASQEQALRERSWLIQQGWESDPGQVPDIEKLIKFSKLAQAGSQL